MMVTCNRNMLQLYITYLLTPWNRVLLEKLTGSAASQKIPLIFVTRKFITHEIKDHIQEYQNTPLQNIN